MPPCILRFYWCSQLDFLLDPPQASYGGYRRKIYFLLTLQRRAASHCWKYRRLWSLIVVWLPNFDAKENNDGAALHH